MIRRNRIFFAVVLLAVSSMSGPRAYAARLAGVTLPDTARLGSQTLILNGIGLRTYSILHVHIYVAGLYLPQPMDNADEILRSPVPKILKLHFVHDVSRQQVQKAWKKGLTDNCVAPCRLDGAELQEFLNTLQPVSAGEDITLVFSDTGLNAYENGRLIGRINDRQYAELMLAVFIGPHVETPALKAELLGLRIARNG